jgi:periplasmic divalent cation tolerance protein
MNLIFVYITNPTKKEARKIANHLLKQRLIACANIFGPINSLYYCKDKIVDEIEFVLIVKTTKANFEKVKNEVEKIHSYSIPCIVKISVSSNQRYFNWLKSKVIKN